MGCAPCLFLGTLRVHPVYTRRRLDSDFSFQISTAFSREVGIANYEPAMRITLYKRHKKRCEHRKERTYKRCDCPVWLAWGKTRKTADTQFWETAQKKARAIEQQYENAQSLCG
jgi:hypothetical protein